MGEPTGELAEVTVGRADALAAAGLVGASLALFGRLLSGGAVLFERDVLNHYWPMRDVVARALARFELPMLDPFHQGGVPLLANLHDGVFYPPNLIFQLTRFPVGYAWLFTLHHVWFGLGSHLFFRRLMPRPAAFLGALAVQLSGYAVGLNTFGPMMNGIAWVPWVAFALSAPRPTLRHAVVASVGLSLQALSGDPMSTIYSGLVGVALAIAWPAAGRRWVSLGGAAVTSLGLAAIQLGPAWVAWTQSTRGADASMALEWSLHPARVLELFGPHPWGGYLEAPGFWARFLGSRLSAIPFVLSIYPGVVCLSLSLAALQKTRAVAFGVALTLSGVLLALGRNGPLGPLLEWVPPFRFFQFPEKYWLLAVLGLGLLAGLGVARLAQGPTRAWWVPAALGAAATLGWGALAASSSLTGLFLADPRQAATARTTISAALLSGMIFFGLTFLLLVLRERVAKRLWLVLLAAVMGADLFANDWELVWTAPAQLYEMKPPLVDRLRADAGETPFRYWRDFGVLEARMKAPGDYRGFVARRAWDVESLKSNLGGVYGLEELSGRSPLLLTRSELLFGALQDQWWKVHALFATPLAFSVPESPRYSDPAHYQKLQSFELDTAIFRALTTNARLSSPSSVRAVSDPAEACRQIAAEGFDATAEALVEGPVPTGVSRAVLSEMVVTAQHVEATVDVPDGAALVVLADAWYPGWKASVDGQSVEAVPVDAALIGAWVPKGHHRLGFDFFDRGLVPGALVSVLSALMCVFGWVTKIGTRSRRS